MIGSDFDVAYHNIEIVRGSPEADKYFKENKQFLLKLIKNTKESGTTIHQITKLQNLDTQNN